jgi:energy-coupling factor transport system ATP-binding protein
MSIKLENVSHRYSRDTAYAITALDHVNLEIHDGEFIGIIGHTGSGKSTLVQHLNGLLKATEGTIYYNGQNIYDKDYDLKDLRTQVGMVFQYPEHQLFEETVFKDVGFGPKNLGLSEAEIKERVVEALQKVGLGDKEIMEKSPFELSGGQMRRVAMAGVLAMRPRILVLDEPAAGLDPQSREDMLQLISGLHKQGSTVVMISHSMDDVARFATRAVVMEHGTIAMEGTPEEIFRHAERLEGMGLDVPSVCKLGMKLRAMGLPCPEDVFREEQALPALLALWKEGKRHGVE